MYIRLAALASSAILTMPIAGSAQDSPSPGTAKIKIDGFEFTVAGDYPATICGGRFDGKGMAYQAKAADYEITIASENRSAGNVPLNTTDGKEVQVSVTVNGRGKSLLRRPSNGGKLIVSEDYKKAEATLELRPVVGNGSSTLRATFVCK